MIILKEKKADSDAFTKECIK